MPTTLITGASRGLGVEFVKQYLERGWTVFAGCRDPEASPGIAELREAHADALHPVVLDVTNEAQIADAANVVETKAGRLDLLINNAGCHAVGEGGLGSVDVERMLAVFHVNAVGPIVVTRDFADLLRKGADAKVVSLTSGAGLLTKRKRNPGEQFSYGASKAALHFMIRTLAFDLKPDGIAVIGMGPGYVLTDMTRGASDPPPLRPPESVGGMIDTIDRVTLDDTGLFFSYDGTECDWMLG
jgi:NAD(P)-dependent dehydrogenase (short-subunit alcohol dehydrogenase family)